MKRWCKQQQSDKCEIVQGVILLDTNNSRFEIASNEIEELWKSVTKSKNFVAFSVKGKKEPKDISKGKKKIYVANDRVNFDKCNLKVLIPAEGSKISKEI